MRQAAKEADKMLAALSSLGLEKEEPKREGEEWTILEICEKAGRARSSMNAFLAAKVRSGEWKRRRVLVDGHHQYVYSPA